MDPSRIQEETGIRFVLFKMALTTGWDCPRAEVMMSFRTGAGRYADCPAYRPHGAHALGAPH
jgi:hypothetical protein